MNIELTSLIRGKIESEGPITIKEFLHQVLQIQNEHFEANASIKWNKPIQESIFGELIADWCTDFWEANGKPNKLKVIIFSPRAEDLISIIPRLQASSDLYIIEPNNYFVKLQKQSLESHIGKITWVDDFDKIPKDTPSITIAKNFFSSLPIDQYTRKKGEWLANVVDLGPNGLHFCITQVNKLNDNMSEYLDAKYPAVQDGGIVELHDETTILLKKISSTINKFGGCILLVDYGYTEHPERLFISSLQAINNKRLAPIFSKLGNNALTSHLNLSNIKEALELANACVHGPITQRDFLANMKIEEKKAKALQRLPEYRHSNLLEEYENLTAAERLGELTKVMAIYNKSNTVAGF